MTEGFWSDARVEVLKREWADGASASAIADLIGGDCTRNQVIGKAHRLGLPGRESPIAPRVRPPTDLPARRGCEYPIGDPRAPDFHFCGAPRAKGAYCDAHYRVCYHRAGRAAS